MASEPSGPGTFRPELQGLRAVAILMVVCYHIWFGRVSGGVDIFLLISSFLLTGSFARKLEAKRPIRVARYWLHAFKRLVPPAALVILLTLGGSLLILPATRWLDLLQDSVASLTYWENWLLVSRAVDYYAADHSTASPLQHYWSLSIQGQVFLLWPLIVGLAAGLLRVPWLRRLRPRTVLTVLFGAVAISSFVWSVIETAGDQTVAYFDTRTRLWEFALGSLLALWLPAIERRVGYRQSPDPLRGRARITRAALGWVGLALILSCGFVVDVQGAFPGWIALWPLLAASLVIAAGPTGTRWGVDRLLASRPLRGLGDASYALYLVHWPLLILTLVALGVSQLDAGIGALVVFASLALSWVLTRAVDSPVRRSTWLDARWWRSAGIIVLSCLLVLTSTEATRAVLDSRQAAAEAQAERNNPGARSLDPGFEDLAPANAAVLPDLAQLPEDWFGLPDHCTKDLAPTGRFADLAHGCRQQGYGRGKVLVIIGDSRDEQAAPAIAGPALQHGWTVVTLFVGGCPFALGRSFEKVCTEHNVLARDYLLSIHPDAVVTSATLVTMNGDERRMPGSSGLLTPLLAAGIDVIGTRALPRLPEDPAVCYAEENGDAGACTMDISDQFAGEPPYAWPSGTQLTPNGGTFYTIDLSQHICPDERCSPEIGRVIVWIDAAHISATYARTLSTAATGQLRAQGFDW